MDIKQKRAMEFFGTELMAIGDEILRKFVLFCLVKAPEYFWTIPASTTGKYHPAYSLGNGGLVRHTKAACKIAIDLLKLEQYRHLDTDTIVSALILHDVIKKREGETYTATEHPMLASSFIVENHKHYEGTFPSLAPQINEIRKLIMSHMGQWNYDYYTKAEVLPKPVTEQEKFVHLCDYLASRKYLTVILD